MFDGSRKGLMMRLRRFRAGCHLDYMSFLRRGLRASLRMCLAILSEKK